MIEYAALAGYQIISGIQQAETIRTNAALSQEINDMNTQYMELDAYHAEQDGYSQAARYKTSIEQTLANQKVTYAAKNVDFTFGTAADMLNETKVNGFLNQLDIQNQAHMRALGYITQARNTRLNSYINTVASNSQAQATINASILGAGSSLATGYASGYNLKQGDKGAYANTNLE